MTPNPILDCPMGENDAEAETVRDYFKALLFALWAEAEAFSGKRPLGNSDWQFEVYESLIKAGLIPGKIEDGEVHLDDMRGADKLIFEAIKQL
jgi:hypothetical protein